MWRPAVVVCEPDVYLGGTDVVELRSPEVEVGESDAADGGVEVGDSEVDLSRADVEEDVGLRYPDVEVADGHWQCLSSG